jgi:predicted nucleic acid-binding Zn ribbon protein
MEMKMPNYKYNCLSCSHTTTFSLKIKDFRSLSSQGNFRLLCEKCKSKKLNRVMNPAGSKIERGREEIAKMAKDEARAITNKIKDGNQSYIRDIFGDE